ncbi:MAG: hypothetical protein WA771_04305 [Chthoniobacterales bacterium]
MVTILVAYATLPPARAFFDEVAAFKESSGIAFPFLAAGLAGGMLPEFLRVTLFQRGRLNSANLKSAFFGFFFWGGMGVLVDVFYQLQTTLFGSDPTLSTVVAKFLFDMLAFTPLIGVPLATTAYLWKSHGFDRAIFADVLNLRGYRTFIVPVLIPNWAVWGPVVCVVYSLPTGLQLPVYILAQAFWTLVLTTLTTSRSQETSHSH